MSELDKIMNDCSWNHQNFRRRGQDKNSNGDRFLEFYVDNESLVGNTWLEDKKIHQVTFET